MRLQFSYATRSAIDLRDCVYFHTLPLHDQYHGEEKTTIHVVRFMFNHYSRLGIRSGFFCSENTKEMLKSCVFQGLHGDKYRS